MKLLTIDRGLGYFLAEDGTTEKIDRITKEDLLRLVGCTLSDDIEMDEYDEKKLQNQAHQIIYKDIFVKLSELVERRDEYSDSKDRMFLDEYDSYGVEMT